MTIKAGSSRAGVDWVGERWERTIIITVDSPMLLQQPLHALPLILPYPVGDRPREGVLEVETVVGTRRS